MNKHDKRIASQLPGGIGALVVEGDVKYALQTWKQDLKRSGTLYKVYEGREFTKPSIKRKRVIETAKFRQSVAAN